MNNDNGITTVPIHAPQRAYPPLTTVSRRLHALVVRVLYARLRIAANLQDHTLLLECYHPSAKLTEPSLHCTYQGTSGLDKDIGPDEALEDPFWCRSEDDHVGRVGELRDLYSSFRLQRQPNRNAPRRRHPAGDVPGSRTFGQQQETNDEAVKQTLSLDSHELFTQLCAKTHLVVMGPRKGIFLSSTEVADGIVRVWRDWLAKVAERDSVVEAAGSSTASEQCCSDDERIMWVNPAKNMGLRVRVRQRKWRRQAPIMMHADEDLPVTYELEFCGKLSPFNIKTSALTPMVELLVRTSHLMLQLEQSLDQISSATGKAVVFASFRYLPSNSVSENVTFFYPSHCACRAHDRFAFAPTAKPAALAC